MTKLSVIIPYTHGDELREQAYFRLRQCIQAQTMQDFEVIIVEQDMGNIPPYFFTNNQRIIVVKDPQSRPFNKSWLVNIGVKNASSNNILVVDADGWLGGMNENYFGYGREDSDLWIRADYINQYSGIPEIKYPLTHQYHHWVVTDTKDAPDYRKNCEIWKATKRDPQKIIDKLKQADLGNIEHPTLIDMEID